jgi:precorrin-3B synthase
MVAAMVTPTARSSAAGATPVADATNCAAPRQRNDACPGALRLHQADDGALARVRVPGGVLDVEQAEALASAARQLGDGDLHLTSRGNVQLRGLGSVDDVHAGAELARLLGAARLLPSPAHERVRNIVASPLAGLDGLGHRDVRDRLVELDRLVCASEELRKLSGRFLFAVDDGRGDVAALGADVTLLATPHGGALLHIGDAALRVPEERAAAAAVTAAEVFLSTARECDVRAWRVADLPLPADELARRTARRLGDGARLTPVAPALPDGPEPPLPGSVPHPSGHTVALCVLAPLGRVTGPQWQLLVDTARETVTPATEERSGELRLTPWRGIVVPGIAPERAPRVLAALAAAGLVTDPASPWRGVSACAGRPGCAKSLTDVRADATAAVIAHGGETAHALPLYWAGCERRCGHPRGERVEVVAEADGYQVSVVRGRSTVRRAVPDSDDHDLDRDHGHGHTLAATVAAARRPTPQR